MALTSTTVLKEMGNVSGDIIGPNLQSTQYLLKVGDKLSSTVKDYNDYAVVQRWDLAMEHNIQGYMSGQVQPRRPSTLSPLEVILYHGDYIPKLFTMVAKQELIANDDTKLAILSSIGDVNQKLFEIALTSATLESVQVSTDYFPFFRVLIRYKKIQITAFNYDQESLSLKGNVPFTYDVTTHEVT